MNGRDVAKTSSNVRYPVAIGGKAENMPSAALIQMLPCGLGSYPI
jgi:hypothetical protein